MLTLPGAHDRGKYLYSCALGQLHYPVNYLVDALLLYLPAALRAVRHAYPRPEKAEIVVYFRNRAHCGARVFRRCFLVDGYRRRKPVNIIHVRLVHLAEEHPETFNVSALPLGINCVKRETGLAAAGKPGYNDKLVARNFKIDVFKIVFSCAFDVNIVLHSVFPVRPCRVYDDALILRLCPRFCRV